MKAGLVWTCVIYRSGVGDQPEWDLPWHGRDAFETPALFTGDTQEASDGGLLMDLMLPDGSLKLIHVNWVKPHPGRQDST